MTQPLVLHAAEETLEAVHTRRHAAYPAYKPSGVEWLGDVPEHWKTLQIRRLFRTVNGATPSSGDDSYWDGDIVWVTPDDLGSYIGSEIADSRRKISEAGYQSCGTTMIPAGSLVVSTRAPIGYIGITQVPLCTNQGCKSLVPTSDLDTKYHYYQLLATESELKSRGRGSTFAELGKTDLSSIVMASPPLEEQQAIARFLDEQTRKIDDLIEAKRSLLDLLKEKRQAVITHAVTRGLDPAAKLKPSGVEWLGDVPEHWEVPPLYARYDAVLGKMLDEKQIVGESLVPYLRNVDVQWDRINTTDLPEMDIAPSDYERFTVRDGDLLVCEGGEVGRCAVWQSQLPLCGFQKAIHRLRPQSSRDIPRFLFYGLRCAATYGAFIAGSNPNTIPHLTGEKLRRHRFPMPPVEEQRAIARFLDEETEKLDDLESVVREAISSLELLRASVISAAVTGKIDVRGEGL